MLRITRQTDYAIILLSQFIIGPAGSAGVGGNGTGAVTSASARDLAARARLPLPMVGKILKALAQKNLLVSHRGPKGGYSLARPASEISVAEIIAALEGPIAVTECNEHLGGCNLESFCMARTSWQRINRAVGEALKGISLEDMTRPPEGAASRHDAAAGLIQIEEAPARAGAGSESKVTA